MQVPGTHKPPTLSPHANCWAEIDLSALAHNVAKLRSQFRAEIMAVLKADAYGHDVKIIAPALAALGITHFGVATALEGATLRSLVGSQSSIFVMTAPVSADSDIIAEHRLIPFVSSLESLLSLNAAGQSRGVSLAVHLEVDTGIGRAGFLVKEFTKVFDYAASLKNLSVNGICTHFTSGENCEDAVAQHQVFENVISALPVDIRQELAIHAANSPAALNLPNAAYSMIRPGLLLYGIDPFGANGQEVHQEFQYNPVLSLRSKVILIRELPKGTPISYGRTYTLPQPARVATIGIGYGDGFPRRLSNIGHVLLPDGTRAPIRGRVCMDQICVEIGPATNLNVGDHVTLIGRVNGSSISSAEVAEMIGATAHEITTCLTARVRRFAVQGQQE